MDCLSWCLGLGAGDSLIGNGIVFELPGWADLLSERPQPLLFLVRILAFFFFFFFFPGGL